MKQRLKLKPCIHLIQNHYDGYGTTRCCYTRTAGALFGNAMTFASAGKASAPGQIDVHELKRILDTIDVDGVFDEQQHKRVKVH